MNGDQELAAPGVDELEVDRGAAGARAEADQHLGGGGAGRAVDDAPLDPDVLSRVDDRKPVAEGVVESLGEDLAHRRVHLAGEPHVFGVALAGAVTEEDRLGPLGEAQLLSVQRRPLPDPEVVDLVGLPEVAAGAEPARLETPLVERCGGPGERQGGEEHPQRGLLESVHGESLGWQSVVVGAGEVVPAAGTSAVELALALGELAAADRAGAQDPLGVERRARCGGALPGDCSLDERRSVFHRRAI